MFQRQDEVMLENALFSLNRRLNRLNRQDCLLAGVVQVFG